MVLCMKSAHCKQYVSYLSNRSSHISTDMKIPKQLWDEKTLDVRHLRVFGCLAIVLSGRKKIEATADHYIMLGYATNQRAYRLSNLVKKKVHIVRDAVFYEDVLSFTPRSLTYSPSPTFETTLPQTFEAPDKEDESTAEEPSTCYLYKHHYRSNTNTPNQPITMSSKIQMTKTPITKTI